MCCVDSSGGFDDLKRLLGHQKGLYKEITVLRTFMIVSLALNLEEIFLFDIYLAIFIAKSCMIFISFECI